MLEGQAGQQQRVSMAAAEVRVMPRLNYHISPLPAVCTHVDDGQTGSQTEGKARRSACGRVDLCLTDVVNDLKQDGGLVSLVLGGHQIPQEIVPGEEQTVSPGPAKQ